jgi:hypothetical protein
MGRELLAKARLHPIESETDETALPTEVTAQPQNEITEWPSIHHSSGRDRGCSAFRHRNACEQATAIPSGGRGRRPQLPLE